MFNTRNGMILYHDVRPIRRWGEKNGEKGGREREQNTQTLHIKKRKGEKKLPDFKCSLNIKFKL